MDSSSASLRDLTRARKWPAIVARVAAGRVRPGLPAQQAMVAAAKHGQIDCLRALLPYNIQNNRVDAEHLRAAATHGHLECLELLLPYCANAVDLALLDAAQHNQARVVKRLLEHPDCDPDVYEGQPLLMAVTYGPSCIEMLWPRTHVAPVIMFLLQELDFATLDSMTPWLTEEQGHMIMNGSHDPEDLPMLRAQMVVWYEQALLSDTVAVPGATQSRKVRL